MRRSVLILGLLLAFLPAHPASARDLVGHLASDPVSLDMAHADDEYSVNVLSNVMDGLTGYDESGKLEFRLAESEHTSRDGHRYVFKLRPGILWSDGRPVLSSEIANGILRTLDPRTGAKLANLFFVIRGAKSYYSGKAGRDQVGVHADPGQVIIDLEKPTPYLLHCLTQPQAAPVREDILAASGGKWPAVAPSTGAYTIASYRSGMSLKLEPNSRYWDKRAHPLPIELKIVPDESTGLRLFEAGNLDFLTRVPALEEERLRKLGRLVDFDKVSTWFLSFNTKKPPFNDREMRQAVAGAVDRQAILRALGTRNTPALSWIPPKLEGFDASLQPAEEFRAAMDSVKRRIQKSPLSISAAFNSNGMNSVVMEKLQHDLKAALGMEVTLSSMDWTTYVSRVQSDTPQLWRYNRGAPFLDPIWHLQSFRSDDANNPTGWKNAEYDRLVDEIATLPSGKLRLVKIRRAQTILVREDALVIPIFYNLQTYAVSPVLKGFQASPIGTIELKSLRRER